MTRSTLILPVLAATAFAAAASDPDARIEAAARRSYTFTHHLKDDDVQVKSRKGTVTLTGTVADSFRSGLAEATVADLPGVKEVVNDLVVSPGAPKEASDAWLAVKVRTALRCTRNVDAGTIQVEAREGEVTLTGTATSAAQKGLAAKVARDVEGVRGVTSGLKVVPASPGHRPLAAAIDDASVTAQVKASLLFHRGTRMLATKVRTEHGVVTIRGTAKNPAEKDLVTRLVAGIGGVRRVENRMAIGN